MTTTTVDNSPEARLARVESSGKGDSLLANNLRKMIDANKAATTGTPTNVDNSTGMGTPVVSGANGIGTMTTSDIGTTETPIDANIDASIQNDRTTQAVATAEVQSQKDITNELSQIDKTQLDTVTQQTQQNQAEYEKFANEQMLIKQKNEEEYQQELRKTQDEDVAALKTLQASEKAANDAALAEMKAKQTSAEDDARIANEVNQQQNNIAFAKLGLSFSTTAVNTATQIFQSGVYKLATLKSTNAKNYADLQVKINKVAFDHQQAVNKLVQDITEKEFASKERLREFIGKTQNNILTSKASANKQIQSAIDKYKQERQGREDKLFSEMNRANDKIRQATADIQKQLTYQQQQAKVKVDMMVANGQWGSLTKEQRFALEQDAGVPAGSTQNTIVAKTTELLSNNLKAIVGRAVGIPPTILAKMHTEVQRALNLNIPLTTATQMAVEKYGKMIPDVKNAQAAASAKANAENAYKKAQADKLLADAESNRIKAQAAATKAASSGSRGGGGSVTRRGSNGTTNTWNPSTSITTDGTQLYYVKGKVGMFYDDGNGNPIRYNGQVINRAGMNSQDAWSGNNGPSNNYATQGTVTQYPQSVPTNPQGTKPTSIPQGKIDTSKFINAGKSIIKGIVTGSFR